MKPLPVHPTSSFLGQRGAALIISLLFLLVLTLVGITGMRGTIMEEKMAGNNRDRNLAFQAAESALRAGEAYLSATPNPVFNNSNGLYQPSPTLWQTIDWSPGSTAVVRYTGNLSSDISAQPAYFIEQLPAVPEPGGSLGIGPVSHQYFRVTARGTGGTTSAVVLLQSVYKR